MNTVIAADPLIATIEEIAGDYVQQFLNGNRKYVIGQIANFPVKEAIAISAKITHSLAPVLQRDFVRLTEIFSNA